MHTEVDVPNPNRVLMPGMYAEATLTLDRRSQVVAVPPEAVNIEGDQRSVWVVDPSGKVEGPQRDAGHGDARRRRRCFPDCKRVTWWRWATAAG